MNTVYYAGIGKRSGTSVSRAAVGAGQTGDLT